MNGGLSQLCVRRFSLTWSAPIGSFLLRSRSQMFGMMQAFHVFTGILGQWNVWRSLHHGMLNSKSWTKSWNNSILAAKLVRAPTGLAFCVGTIGDGQLKQYSYTLYGIHDVSFCGKLSANRPNMVETGILIIWLTFRQKRADSFYRKTDAKTPQTGAKIRKRTQNRKSGHLLNLQNVLFRSEPIQNGDFHWLSKGFPLVSEFFTLEGFPSSLHPFNPGHKTKKWSLA